MNSVYANYELHAAEQSTLLASVTPSKGDGARTDTFRPHPAYGQQRNTETRQRLRDKQRLR